MERAINDVCREVYTYWSEVINEADTPLLPVDIKNCLTACDKNLLIVAIRTCSPLELYRALEEEDEKLKFYYMQRIWYRYADLLYGRTEYDYDGITLTDESSIRELDISIESMKLLSLEGIERLNQLPERMQNLPYANVLDIVTGLSVLERRKAYC